MTVTIKVGDTVSGWGIGVSLVETTTGKVHRLSTVQMNKGDCPITVDWRNELAWFIVPAWRVVKIRPGQMMGLQRFLPGREDRVCSEFWEGGDMVQDRDCASCVARHGLNWPEGMPR